MKAQPPLPTEDSIDQILIGSYRYFNKISPWNLDDRIPEALIADKAALLTQIDRIVDEVIGENEKPPKTRTEDDIPAWRRVTIGASLRAEQRSRWEKIRETL